MRTPRHSRPLRNAVAALFGAFAVAAVIGLAVPGGPVAAVGSRSVPPPPPSTPSPTSIAPPTSVAPPSSVPAQPPKRTEGDSLGVAEMTLTAPSDVTFGQPIGLEARLRDASGSCTYFLDCNTPSGTVFFYDQTHLVGQATLHPSILVHQSVANVSVSGLAPGIYFFSMFYTGDFNSSGVDAPRGTEVLKASCDITLAISRNVTSGGDTTPLVYTADLGSPGHTGTVYFTSPSGSVYGLGSVTDGQHATYTLPYIPPGTFDVSATYSGDGNFAGCVSNAQQHTTQVGEIHYGEVRYPHANNDSETVAAGSPLVIDVLANDDVGNQGAVTLALAGAGPMHGTAVVTADYKIAYALTGEYTGTDHFDYTITDGTSPSTATVTINAICISVAADDLYATGFDTPLTRADPGVLSNDVRCGTTVAIVTQATHGSVQLAATGGFTYSPASGYTGADSFQYTVSSNPDSVGTVTVNVGGNVCTPALLDDAYTATHGVLDVTDPGVTGNDSLCGERVAVTQQPAHGTLILTSTGGVTYRAANGYNGPDQFSYGFASGDVPTGAGRTDAVQATATVRLTVTAQLPVALPPTGSASGPVLWLAMLTIPAGVVLLLVSRRRRIL